MSKHMAAVIRKLANAGECTFSFRKHAEDRLIERGLAKFDAINILKRCSVEASGVDKGEMTWRCVGTDADGARWVIVVVPYETQCRIKVITCFPA